MIFWFSGTGNSKLAAERIAEITGDETVSLNELSKKGEKRTFNCEKPLVFVCPVYAWRLPRVAEKLIEECSFEGDTRAYFILTCGAESGAAALYAEKLCKKKGFAYMGTAVVIMPDNFAPMLPVADGEQAKIMIDNAIPVIDGIGEVIKSGGIFEKRRAKAVDKAKSAIINSGFYRFYIKDGKYFATDKCVSCGKCAEVCPLNNVRIADGKPEWLGNCTLCMACYSCCPTEAVEYGKATAGRNRYRADKF